VVYRHAGDDEGLTLHVFGPAAGGEQEVLRFDCFRRQPHYHLGWSYRDEPLVPIAAADPFAWSLEQLRTNPQALLQRAHAEPMRPEELSLLPAVIDDLRARGESLLHEL
jgi:hypothetical protein